MKNLFAESFWQDFGKNEFLPFLSACRAMAGRVRRERINHYADLTMVPYGPSIGRVNGNYRFSKYSFHSFLYRLIRTGPKIFREISGRNLTKRPLPADAYSLSDAIEFYNRILAKRFKYIEHYRSDRMFYYLVDDVIEDVRSVTVAYHFNHADIVDMVLNTNKKLKFCYGSLDGVVMTGYFYLDAICVEHDAMQYVPAWTIMHNTAKKSVQVKPHWLRLQDRALLSLELLIGKEYVLWSKNKGVNTLDRLKKQIQTPFQCPFDAPLFQNFLEAAKATRIGNIKEASRKVKYAFNFGSRIDGGCRVSLFAYLNNRYKNATLYDVVNYLLYLSIQYPYRKSVFLSAIAGKWLVLNKIC